MALKSETHSLHNGGTNVYQPSDGDDLEDGEIEEEEIESQIVNPIVISAPNEKLLAGNAENKLNELLKKPLLGSKPPLLGQKSGEDSRQNSNEKLKQKRQNEDIEFKSYKEPPKKHRRDERDRKGGPEDGTEGGEVDEEEMLFVRGASPLRSGQSHRAGHIDRYDSQNDEDSDGERGRDRGRDRRPPRGIGRGFRGVRGGRRIERPIRGKRRGRGGLMMGRKRDDHPDNVCIFFMQGKCHRGLDCPYSHDIMPQRKMELCKFYLMDCCAKKDKCLYMHNDFPCKYYQTGLKCYAGKNCKFSHGKMNEQLKSILLKQHLETAPKEILGDFPRMTRDGIANMIRNKKDRKIPSLFDLKIPVPVELNNRDPSESDGNHTPMPSPTPNELRNHEREITPEREEEKRGGEKRKRKDEEKEREKEARRERKKEREERHRRNKEERREDHRREKEKMKERRAVKAERELKREAERERERERGKDSDIQAEEKARRKSELSETEQQLQAQQQQILQQQQLLQHQQHLLQQQQLPHRGGELKTEEEMLDDGGLPAHLPKKQRELFLRIQQQQREAKGSQASEDGDDDVGGDNRDEENWYSSDEETLTPLTAILRNLQCKPTTSTTVPTQSPPPQTAYSSTTMQAPILPSTLPVVIPEGIDISKLLSSVRQVIQVGEERQKPVFEKSFSSVEQPVEQSIMSPNDERRLSTEEKRFAVDGGRLDSEDKQFDSQDKPLLIQEQRFSSTTPPYENRYPSPPAERRASTIEEKRVRDPRFRVRQCNSAGGGDSILPVPAVPILPPSLTADIDIRSSALLGPGGDIDLRHLPFKPVPVHSAANEIDASLTSHSPIFWRLIPLILSKPDYSAILLTAKTGANDPRLRRPPPMITPRMSPREEPLVRDPRQRVADLPKPNDPRQRPSPAAIRVPMTPRYQDPYPEEEPYVPGGACPVDPRQRVQQSAIFLRRSPQYEHFPPATPTYNDSPTYTDPRLAQFIPPTNRHFDSDTDLRLPLASARPNYKYH